MLFLFAFLLKLVEALQHWGLWVLFLPVTQDELGDPLSEEEKVGAM